jgi:hypothetical protein
MNVSPNYVRKLIRGELASSERTKQILEIIARQLSLDKGALRKSNNSRQS